MDKTILDLKALGVKLILLCAAGMVFLLPAGMLATLVIYALSSDSVESYSGMLPAITGSLYTACVSLAIVVPLSLSVVIYAGEYCRGTRLSQWIRNSFYFGSSIPAVIWGICGYFMLQPWGLTPFSVALVIAWMIVPYTSNMLLGAIDRVHNERMGAYSLGAIPITVIFKITLPSIRKEFFAAYFLAFGRALGETLIVVMLLGHTMTSELLFSFDSFHQVHSGMFFLMALVLFILTAVCNLIARYLLKRKSL
ncbi:MAG: ABC transporter permease subunit [Candidatus Symbiothrix sp.]|jgi:phosphate transport system permease protein|nr:ABC transporter permease subunit [Candidatus Symbiothrix sp.]